MQSGTHSAILLRKIACWWTAPNPPEQRPVPELAARFCETLYSWPLAHKIAQADGTVKGQDKQVTPAYDRTTGLCNSSQGEKAAPQTFSS